MEDLATTSLFKVLVNASSAAQVHSDFHIV